MNSVQFPYVERNPKQGPQSLAPLLPLSLQLGEVTVDVAALLDSGASLSVLPFDVGVRLGAAWERQTVDVPLAGTLRGVPAKGLLLTGVVGSFPPVRLAFAWAQSDDVPVILGQTNFFAEFDICFFRSRSLFEIKPK
jgi:hypothetical protein